MKISSVSRNVIFNGKASFHPVDLSYKKALQKGLADTFDIKCKIDDMESIAGPYEFMNIIKNLKPENYKPGKNFRANFHIHTDASDGLMTVNDFLNNCIAWIKKLRECGKKQDQLPLFSAAITDHDRAVNSKIAMAEIVKEPEKYKDFKFISGCEFMFGAQFDDKKVWFEAVGLGFNPFDSKLDRLMKGFASNNKILDISDIKASGGVLSWAHPLISPERVNEKFMDFLKKNGVEGIEADYQYQNFDYEYINAVTRSTDFENLVKKMDMFRTGGTDSHGSSIFGH